jgi:transcriptional regulator with XRE-family HTH domain
MASRCGVSSNAVIAWEQGRSFPSPARGLTLTTAYDAPLTTIGAKIVYLAVDIAKRRAAA